MLRVPLTAFVYFMVFIGCHTAYGSNITHSSLCAAFLEHAQVEHNSPFLQALGNLYGFRTLQLKDTQTDDLDRLRLVTTPSTYISMPSDGGPQSLSAIRTAWEIRAIQEAYDAHSGVVGFTLTEKDNIDAFLDQIEAEAHIPGQWRSHFSRPNLTLYFMSLLGAAVGVSSFEFHEKHLVAAGMLLNLPLFAKLMTSALSLYFSQAIYGEPPMEALRRGYQHILKSPNEWAHIHVSGVVNLRPDPNVRAKKQTVLTDIFIRSIQKPSLDFAPQLIFIGRF